MTKKFLCPYCGTDLIQDGVELVQEGEAKMDVYLNDKGEVVGYGETRFKGYGDGRFVCKKCGKDINNIIVK